MKSQSESDSVPKRVVFRKRWTGIYRAPLQHFANELSARLAGGNDFTCLLTDEDELAQLNLQFRGKRDTTDVLSFPAPPSDGYLGDIAVSVPHARRYARDHGHALEEEIRVLMLHGMLHLLGMDHETDAGAMKRAESRWRKHFGLPAGLIQRTR